MHRDIKPENVLILRDTANEVRLLDFGLSKMIGTVMGSAARTFVGTPCYLAPEVRHFMRGTVLCLARWSPLA